MLSASAVVIAAALQWVLAKRLDLMPVTASVGATALLAGLPVGLWWGAWALAAVCVGLAVWRRRRLVGRAGLLALVLVVGLALHGAVAALPSVPSLAWWCAGVFLSLVVAARCMERGHDARQVRWVGEIPIREPHRPTTST